MKYTVNVKEDKQIVLFNGKKYDFKKGKNSIEIESSLELERLSKFHYNENIEIEEITKRDKEKKEEENKKKEEEEATTELKTVGSDKSDKKGNSQI